MVGHGPLGRRWRVDVSTNQYRVIICAVRLVHRRSVNAQGSDTGCVISHDQLTPLSTPWMDSCALRDEAGH